jgi:phosphoribulokinase
MTIVVERIKIIATTLSEYLKTRTGKISAHIKDDPFSYRYNKENNHFSPWEPISKEDFFF